MPIKNSAKQSPEDIKKAYLFSGEIDPRRDAAVDEIIAQLVDEGSEVFDLERLEGDSTSAEDVLAAVMTAPLCSKRKVVIVNHVERLDPSDQVRLAEFLPKLGTQSCLILLVGDEDSPRIKSQQGSGGKKTSGEEDQSEDDEEKEEKKKRKKGLQPEVTKAVKAHGAVITFAKMGTEDLGVLVAKAVRSQGKKIEPAALQTLTRMVSAHPAALEKEIEKLATYVAERDTITLDDVESVVTESPEDRVFPLIDAIGAHRPGQAVHLLSETLAASSKIDSEVLRIISMLARHFRFLYQTKFLKSQNVRWFGSVPEDLREMLPEGKKNNVLSTTDWQQKRFLAQADAFTLDELQEALKQILLCELAAKGLGRGEGSPRLNLETLVLKLSQRRRR